jgi:hypothetical protein
MKKFALVLLVLGVTGAIAELLTSRREDLLSRVRKARAGDDEEPEIDVVEIDVVEIDISETPSEAATAGSTVGPPGS